MILYSGRYMHFEVWQFTNNAVYVLGTAVLVHWASNISVRPTHAMDPGPWSHDWQHGQQDLVGLPQIQQDYITLKCQMLHLVCTVVCKNAMQVPCLGVPCRSPTHRLEIAGHLFPGHCESYSGLCCLQESLL